MKYKIILIFLLTSCIQTSYEGKKNFLYSAKGFAKIENQSFFDLGNGSFVFHDKLNSGTKIRLINPDNGKSLEIVVIKKIKYDNFYKVLISENIVKELGLDPKFPYVEINEIKKNKSFIAKKAITETVEKNIANKAPVDKISINNLTKSKKFNKTKLKKYSILVAEFYSLDSAKILKERLLSILTTSNYKLIYISKINENSYKLLMGPYNTVMKLKNDYIVLNDSNFEDLDIIIND